ncbi:MAG TPA: phage holin family protein [Candidatus Dormibacteraeota bacterium]|jgi:purine-cytosine permease-like protein|nr:phage holin family protein [Candidatus Dormibacteraeota bacterium]
MAARVQEDEDLSALLHRITEDTTRLVRLEIELAKEQAKESAIRSLKAGIFLGIALACAFLGFIYALGAVPAAIGGLLGHAWLGWLIFGVLLFVIAAICGLIGYRRVMSTVRTTKEAVGTFKEDFEWVKELPRRGVERSS